MKPYPVADDLLSPVLRVAMPGAVGSAAFLTDYVPSCGRRRIMPPLQEFEHSEAQRGVRYLPRPLPQTASAQQVKGEWSDGAIQLGVLPGRWHRNQSRPNREAQLVRVMSERRRSKRRDSLHADTSRSAG